MVFKPLLMDHPMILFRVSIWDLLAGLTPVSLTGGMVCEVHRVYKPLSNGTVD